MPPRKRSPAQLELPVQRADPARVAALASLDPADRDAAIVAALVTWFDGVARDLPWRRRRDPYAVWLSEIMLQQTRVDTVIPYFERFLQRFPDVTALAGAEIDEVLKLWSGLGYYRRARVLYATAREVTERYGGLFPGEAAGLRALPGIGAYTAGAIASLAFDRREPLVDGNVARVFARLFGIDDPIRSAATTKRLWEIAWRLVPAERPGRFNESLMELGAMVCTPRDPHCDACPLAELCSARAAGRVAELPVIEEKKKVPVVKMVAAVVRSGRRVLLARREEGGLFGGLWEPPMVEAASIEEARALLHAVGVGSAVELREAGNVKHVLSHKELRVAVATASVTAKPRAPGKLAAPYEKAVWVDPDDAEIGISTLARKVLAAAGPG